MKKKSLVIALVLVVTIFWLLFFARLKMSNDLKSWLLREDSNWVIQQVSWWWNDMSISVNGPQTALRIPISSVVPETLTRKDFKFKLNLYDENWNKLNVKAYWENSNEWWNWTIILIYKDTILWMKEYKIPLNGLKRISDDVYEVDLSNFDWYSDVNGWTILYKLLWRWKIDSVYLQILHWSNVKLEFSVIE